MGDQLEAYVAAVDFEIFRADLDTALAYADGGKGGRPPYDAVLMFKILLIEAQNNLSDDRAEFLIGDRLSFMRFLGPGLQDKVPDAFRCRPWAWKTIDARCCVTPGFSTANFVILLRGDAFRTFSKGL